jgi:alkaline phosphatase D
MYKFLPTLALLSLLLSCQSGSRTLSGTATETASEPIGKAEDKNAVFQIAFGSCNRTEIPNPFWDDILQAGPDLWIWGGDNIYADTGDWEQLQAMYQAQKEVPGYKALIAQVPVIGTWDDHDYGLNDGGVEFEAKAVSQRAFLDFMGVPQESPRRAQEGIYSSHTYSFGSYSVKILVLDTRYFRSALQADPSGKKRYIPHPGGEWTVLGPSQWEWLERELRNSSANFNILVSSIQVLSGEHGFESWRLFPDETQRLIQLIRSSGAKAPIIISGDRHISEFSRLSESGMPYELIDFTSSGLTHAYRSFEGEPNPYRVGEVVAEESFGFILLDGARRKATLQIRGAENRIIAEFSQEF